MNRIHRTVWNEARGTYVVAHEKSKAKGKSSTSVSSVAGSVAAALLAMGASHAAAADACSTPLVADASITTSIAGPCTLQNGANLSVTTDGTVSGGSYGVEVPWGGVAGGVTNAGLISGGFGINLSSKNTIGAIVNSGTISGVLAPDSGHGISLTYAATASGGIANSGTTSAIIGTNTGIMSTLSNYESLFNTIHSGISNEGTIAGLSAGGIWLDETNLDGGIRNNGTVSVISGGYDGVHIYKGTFGGGITNNGLIQGTSNHGIQLETTNFAGGITNSGTNSRISGALAGVYLGSTTFAGNIQNQGVINSDNYGIKAVATTISGSINNSGLILGGATFSNDIAEITFANNTYSGGIDGINLNASTITGGINNIGTMSAIAGERSGISVSETRIDGGINNEGIINGGIAGVSVGRLLRDPALGNEFLGNSTLTGNISASGNVIINNGINNSGVIIGQLAGIKVGQFVVNSTASGNIDINTNISISGGINNSGTVAGLLAGVAIGKSGVESSNTTSGAINISGDINISGGITNSGTIFGLVTGMTIGQFNQNTLSGSVRIDGDVSNSGNISALQGIGLAILGNSTLSGSLINSGTISGAASIFSGNLTENLSENLNNNISGGIINQQSGVLNGALKVGGTTSVTNHGLIVLPSGTDSVIQGDFTQSATGTLRIGVAGQSNYSQLAVGNATLAGTLDIDVTANTLSGTLLDVITASGSITGKFGAVTDNSDLFDFSAIYRGTQSVDLDVNAASSTGVYDDVVAENNTPGIGAANALDYIFVQDPNGQIATLFQPLTTQRQVSDAVSQVLPLLTGGMTQATNNALHGINRIIQSRQEGLNGRSSGDEFFGDKNVWFKPFGSWTNQGDRNGVSGYDANSVGMVFGADKDISDTNRIGVAFAYARSNIDSNSSVARQSGDVNSYQLVAYGTHNISDVTDISFQADIARHNNQGSRVISFANSTAKSDYNSWSGHLGLALSQTHRLSEKTSLIPSVRVDYTKIRDESYNETGAGALNLNVGKNTTEELILGVDGKLSHALTEKSTLTANLGLGYDVINDQASITSAFAGAPATSFVTQGLDPSPWLVRGGLGISGKATETLELSARYDIEAREDFDNQTASVKARWAF